MEKQYSDTIKLYMKQTKDYIANLKKTALATDPEAEELTELIEKVEAKAEEITEKPAQDKTNT